MYSHVSCSAPSNSPPPQGRKDMPLDDVVALYTSLVNLALKCYPAEISYVDKALECTADVFKAREAAP